VGFLTIASTTPAHFQLLHELPLFDLHFMTLLKDEFANVDGDAPAA
jgi:hypothetical protein